MTKVSSISFFVIQDASCEKTKNQKSYLSPSNLIKSAKYSIVTFSKNPTNAFNALSFTSIGSHIFKFLICDEKTGACQDSNEILVDIVESTLDDQLNELDDLMSKKEIIKSSPVKQILPVVNKITNLPISLDQRSEFSEIIIDKIVETAKSGNAESEPKIEKFSKFKMVEDLSKSDLDLPVAKKLTRVVATGNPEGQEKAEILGGGDLENDDTDSTDKDPVYITDEMPETVINILKNTGAAAISKKDIKLMQTVTLESADQKLDRQNQNDKTWYEQNYYDRLSKNKVRKNVVKHKDAVKEINTFSAKSVGKISSDLVKNTCKGCKPSEFKTDSKNLGSMKMDQNPSGSGVAGSNEEVRGLKVSDDIDLDIEEDDQKNNNLPFLGNSKDPNLRTIDPNHLSRQRIGKSSDFSNQTQNFSDSNTNENADETIDDPNNLKEAPSKQLKSEMDKQNEVVTSASDILIGKSAKLSMNSNLSGKNVKLQIKNDESSVSRVYIEAPQTTKLMNYFGSKNHTIDQIPGTTGTTMMKTTKNDGKNSTTATVVLETNDENINGEKQSEQSEHKTNENKKKDNIVLEIQEMNPSSTTDEFSEGSGSQSMSISKFEITTQNSAILR